MSPTTPSADTADTAAPPAYDPSAKQKSQAKTARIPIKVVPAGEVLKKPEWIRVKAGSPTTRFYDIKKILREHKLHTVCEEASCPNIGECFGKGTATFMIMGDKCTRRCPFCDVGHGRPDPLDADEPLNLARTIAALKLSYVVITSVDRDDLRDGGAAHFVACIEKTRELSPSTRIEILVPDFRGRDDRALGILRAAPPMFNSQFPGVVAMGVATLIFFLLPWLDRSPVNSIRYKGPLFRGAITIFVVVFLILGYLGTEPTNVWGQFGGWLGNADRATVVARVCTIVYFLFFLLMPWYSSIDKCKPVPERVTC